MKTWIKVLLVTLVTGLPTIALGRIIWPDPVSTGGMAGMDMGSTPIGLQLPLLIGISVFEAAAFGLGISFLLFGLPAVRRATGGNTPLMWAASASIAWSLISWWPHDNLHRVSSSLDNLIVIEYTFHVTLIAAAATIAFTFLRLISQSRESEHVAVSARTAEQNAPSLTRAAGR